MSEQVQPDPAPVAPAPAPQVQPAPTPPAGSDHDALVGRLSGAIQEGNAKLVAQLTEALRPPDPPKIEAPAPEPEPKPEVKPASETDGTKKHWYWGGKNAS